MGTLSEYFEKTAYKPKYHLGDRVFGRWNKIPFIGTVGNDRNKVGSEDPEITVLLDLPISHKGEVKSVIIVKHKDIKPLKEFDL